MKNYWLKIPAGYKKAFATAVGSLLVAFFEQIGLSIEQAALITSMIISFVWGQSYVDRGKYASEKEPTITKA